MQTQGKRSMSGLSPLAPNIIGKTSIEGVIVYDHVPECHVTFGRGGLHNV